MTILELMEEGFHEASDNGEENPEYFNPTSFSKESYDSFFF